MSDAELEQMNFRNLVEYHREDLQRIIEGEPASKVLSWSRHSNLNKYGVLARLGRGDDGRFSAPTPRAIAILNGDDGIE